MALTLRLNGSQAQNLVTASWWNDYYNLLTGVMTDQPVTIKPNLTLQNIQAALGAPTLALAAGTALGIGAYLYSITAVLADGGESGVFNQAPITTTSGNQVVSLTAIPTGPTGTVKRNIYRSKVGGSVLYYVATVGDNVTTTYTDATADASLGFAASLHPSFGGSLMTRDQSGNLITLDAYDGAAYGTRRFMAWGPAPASGGSAALQAGSGLGIGAYQYVVTFVSGSGFGTGESAQSPTVNITTTNGNQQVVLSNLPLGPAGTTQRNIYRTAVGGSTFKLLTSISSGIVTTYTDSTADASLGSTNPPAHSTFGGALMLYNGAGANSLSLYNDGTVGMSGGQNILLNGLAAANGEALGSISIAAGANGRANGNADLMLVNTTGGNMYFKVAAGKTFQFNDTNENIMYVARNAGTGILAISGGDSGGGIGFKTIAGTQLAEMRGNGNFVIGGNTYQTSQSTYNTAASQAFDAFDVGECYETDVNYPIGTVVVLNPALGKMTKCTTDGNPLAHVIVNSPAFCIGSPDPVNMIQPIALAGRVMANTAATITAGQLVCSDNNGGVRPLAVGEWNHVIGVSIGPNASGQVPLILRPMYAKG